MKSDVEKYEIKVTKMGQNKPLYLVVCRCTVTMDTSRHHKYNSIVNSNDVYYVSS